MSNQKLDGPESNRAEILEKRVVLVPIHAMVDSSVDPKFASFIAVDVV